MALEWHQSMAVEEYFQLEESDPNGIRYEYENAMLMLEFEPASANESHV